MKVFKKAMTMAEVLLSLTIIGVVSAITMPLLQNNINEKSWATKKKALYSRLSQAIPLIGTLDGFGIGTTDSATIDNAAHAFLIQGLQKQLQIGNICDNNKIKFKKCGFASTIVRANGTKTNFPTNMQQLNSDLLMQGNDAGRLLNTKVIAFDTLNGDSVAIFYNPYCGEITGDYDSWTYSQSSMCVNFLYDLNGRKGPNTIGKDMGFITALYPFNTVVVAPQLTNNNPSGIFDGNLLTKCNISKKEIIAPSKEEIFSIFYNKELIGMNGTCLYSTDSSVDAENAYNLNLSNGKWQKESVTNSCLLPCVNK